MKRICFLCITLLTLLSSCNIDDNDPANFYYEILPIESVEIPSEFEFGQIYQISVTYLRPSECHIFNDFYYVSELNQHTIAVINTVFTDGSCDALENEEVEVSFDFQVNNYGAYIFKFWQGKDENGNDLYYIVEVPVAE